MTWGQRLKRVFDIDIETCQACGGALCIIACIDDPEVIEKILTHLDSTTTESMPCNGRRAGRRPSAECSTKPDQPTTTTEGCDATARPGRRLALWAAPGEHRPPKPIAGVDADAGMPLTDHWRVRAV